MLTMTAADWATVIFLLLLNVSILIVFFKTMGEISIKDIVAEKSSDPNAPPETSSSRVIGFVGGMTMTCFVWAVANIVVFLGIYNAGAVTNFLSAIGGFLVSGTALFLPYAVNKITDVAKPAVQQNTDKAKVDADKKKATDTSTKQIDDAAGAGPLDAVKMKAIVGDAIKTATGG